MRAEGSRGVKEGREDEEGRWARTMGVAASSTAFSSGIRTSRFFLAESKGLLGTRKNRNNINPYQLPRPGEKERKRRERESSHPGA